MAPAAILLIAGTAASVASTLQQGQIAKAQGEFQEKVSNRNRDALERQAKAELQAAKLDEKRIARKQKLVEGAEVAMAAKSGIGLAGASINALADTAFQFSLDRNLRLRRGLIAGMQLKERGSILAAQGKFAAKVGRQRQTASFIKAGGSILSTAGSSFGGGTSVTGLRSTTAVSNRSAFPSTTQNFPASAF